MRRNLILGIFAVSASLFLVSCSALGNILPDRLIYPTDMKTMNDDDAQISEADAGEPEVMAEERSTRRRIRRVDTNESIAFGSQDEFEAEPIRETRGIAEAEPEVEIREETPSRAAIRSERLDIEDNVYTTGRKGEIVKDGWVYKPNDPNFVPHPVPQRHLKRYPKKPIAAARSNIGKKALTRSFDIGFEDGWDAVLDVLMEYPLHSVDKSSGIIITGWVMDQKLSNEILTALNIFGDGVRLIRYKYVVRVYDDNGFTEVTAVPFIQVTKNRRWHDGKPNIGVTEKLMRKIIKKMGG